MNQEKSSTRKQRWVIKIGSALLTNDGTALNHAGIKLWVQQMAELKRQGIEILLVSSGAVAAGVARMGWSQRPSSLPDIQAAAAIGQMGLMQTYDRAFAAQDCVASQVLLTHDDLSNRQRYLNARNTLTALLKVGVVPIINENDTVITDEIKFGDNDTLGALVANLIEADRLIILTDQDGLFTADPRKTPDARLIECAKATDEEIVKVAGGAATFGRGGMITKVRAAQLAARSGAHTYIVGGRLSQVLLRLAKGEALGSLLEADETPLVARKRWIAGHLQASGSVVIDEGAVAALVSNGKSLLAAGIQSVQGQFTAGALIRCHNLTGKVIAKGFVNYSTDEIEKIKGLKTAELANILGYEGPTEVIHRDNLVIV